MNIDYLPLKSYIIIVEDNAHRMDCDEAVSKEWLHYIICENVTGKKEVSV